MPEQASNLPPVEPFREAACSYLRVAYPEGAPAAAGCRLPQWVTDPREQASSADLEALLNSEAVEREPGGTMARDARALSVRLGNSAYPHMKLRLARPPRRDELLFSVDSHDGFLTPGAAADAAPLEELKRHNAEVAREIHSRWDNAGVPTEAAWLRSRVIEAQQRGGR